jgi:hypothetical protein
MLEQSHEFRVVFKEIKSFDIDIISGFNQLPKCARWVGFARLRLWPFSLNTIVSKKYVFKNLFRINCKDCDFESRLGMND